MLPSLNKGFVVVVVVVVVSDLSRHSQIRDDPIDSPRSHTLAVVIIQENTFLDIKYQFYVLSTTDQMS